MSTTGFLVIIFLVAILIVAIGAIAYLIYEILDKKKQLKFEILDKKKQLKLERLDKKKQLEKYQGIADVQAEQARIREETGQINKQNDSLRDQQAKLRQEENDIKEAITNLKKQVTGLEDELDIRAYGLYEPKYDFDTAARYKVEIDQIRQQQKQMIRDKEAAIFEADLTVEGSKVKGRKMMNEQVRLMLRAFNGECDALILKVKYNNVIRIETRIKSVYDAINKLGQSKRCSITPDYFNLKIKELHAVHEYQEKRQAEIEEQRRIREQMREEQRALKEIEKAKQDAEKEEGRYQKALERARIEITKATGEKQAKFQSEIERLNQLLQEAHEKRERAMSRAQMTKSGYVYVISNIGSFGEDIYKIGMTRRLEPMDRVKELGDASVPFRFDVHAMIYSENAPVLENALHKAFHYRSVNRVNKRKEFFNVSLKEIEKVVLENHGEVEFTLLAEAEEFKKTQSIISKETANINVSDEVYQPELVMS